MADTCDWCRRPCSGPHWTSLSGECGAHLAYPVSRRAVAADDCAAARYRWLTAEVARLTANYNQLEHDTGREIRNLQEEINRLRPTDQACGEIHQICTDAGVPPGHVVERMRGLVLTAALAEARGYAAMLRKQREETVFLAAEVAKVNKLLQQEKAMTYQYDDPDIIARSDAENSAANLPQPLSVADVLVTAEVPPSLEQRARAQCPNCLRPRGFEGATHCYAHSTDATGQDVRECLTLAEARKPRWRRPRNNDHTAWELVLADVVIAQVWFSCGTWNWCTLRGRGEGNLEFAKAAAEAALGEKP